MTLLKSQVIEALRKITSPGEGGNLIDAGVVKNIVIFGEKESRGRDHEGDPCRGI